MQRTPPKIEILDLFTAASTGKLSYPDLCKRYADRLTDANLGSCVYALVDAGDLIQTRNEEGEPLFELSSNPRTRLDFYKEDVSKFLMELQGEWCRVIHIVAGLGGSQDFSQTALTELCFERKVVFAGQGQDTRYYWRTDASDKIVEAFDRYIQARDVVFNL